MIRIVLAEDHHVVRQALKTMLELEQDFQVVGEAGTGLETIQVVQEQKPDVLVLDLMMPSLNGLEVVRQISRKEPHTRIVILSMHSDESYVLEALEHGALAYVLKTSQFSHLIEAIHTVVRGRRYLSPPLSEVLLNAYLDRSREAFRDPYESLTAREREVLQLVAEGLTNVEVASKLGISPRTVEVHRAHLMRKLRLRNQADLVRFALKRTNPNKS